MITSDPVSRGFALGGSRHRARGVIVRQIKPIRSDQMSAMLSLIVVASESLGLVGVIFAR